MFPLAGMWQEPLDNRVGIARGLEKTCSLKRLGYSRATMKEWFQLAFQPSVVKRALRYAVIVGIILISINHLDAILRGEVTRGRLFKMGLTVVVPYVVSTLSSVGALRQKGRD